INANFPGLLTLIERIHSYPDIIVLTECRLSQNPTIPLMDGYNYNVTQITHNQNDGVVVYTKSTLTQVTVTEPVIHDSSCLLVTLGTDIAIVAVYRPFAFRDPSRFIQSLDSLLQQLKAYSSIILAGDINIDISNEQSNVHSIDYMEVLAHHGLFLGHNFPTDDRTCLDHLNLKTGNNSKQVWKTIQSITNSGKTKSPAENLLCLKENRQLSVDEVNSYYANICRQLVDKINNSAFAARSHTSILCPNSFVLFSTDESEVERVVTSLKNNTSMGWDGIST
ncbi:unnamed protein product, partial [Leptidea sinapis]